MPPDTTPWEDVPAGGQHVGILAIEIYTPKQQVLQSELEQRDGCVGKYTLGLGQVAMSFATDREDPISMALTVVRNLLDGYGVPESDIGRVEVASESSPDRCKSIKSHLMRLFTQPQQHSQPQHAGGPSLGATVEAGLPGLAAAASATAMAAGAAPAVAAEVGSTGPGTAPATAVAASAAPTAHAQAASAEAVAGAAAVCAATTVEPANSSAAALDAAGAAREAGALATATPATTVRQGANVSFDHSADIEGADTVHGCYGGTAALLNACAWVAAPGWNGQLALVVATDVAVYAPGSSAQATGGCGAVALLIGPNAPLVLDPHPAWRTTHSAHQTDFCKPAGSSSPYPIVNGAETVNNFLGAVHVCYSRLRNTLQPLLQPLTQQALTALSAVGSGLRGGIDRGSGDSSCQSCSSLSDVLGPLSLVQHAIFHAPFHKITRKAFARMRYIDLQAGATAGIASCISTLAQLHLPASVTAAAADTVDRQPHDSMSTTAAADKQNGQRQQILLTSGTEHQSAGRTETSFHAAGQQESVQLQTGCHVTAQQQQQQQQQSSHLTLGHHATGQQHAVHPAGQLLSTVAVDKQLEAQLLQLTCTEYDAKVGDAAWMQRHTGNTYTACLFMGLASLVDIRGPELVGQRILMFGFGSGVVATMYCLVGREVQGEKKGGAETAQVAMHHTNQQHSAETGVARIAYGVGKDADQQEASNSKSITPRHTPASSNCGGTGSIAAPSSATEACGSGKFSLSTIRSHLQLRSRVHARIRRSPAEFDTAAALVAGAFGAAPYQPQGALTADELQPGTFYLHHVDAQSRREYAR